MIYILIYCI